MTTPDWSKFASSVEDRRIVKRCPVCVLLDSVSPEDAVQIKAVLANQDYSHRAVYDAFRAHGEAIGRDRISDHRNGRCT